ncbi:MAG: AsmA-like C-terminal region-containing protein, partial [Candidatus Eiseniibacteriota bacterium]
VTLKPISVTSGANTFSLSQAVAMWTLNPDKTFNSKIEAKDQGLDVAVTLGGSAVPGSATSGSVNVHALATRLNGLVPNGPTWRDGALACRAVFTSQPPALPVVGWTATGEGLAGDVPGLMKPIQAMAFDVGGDEHVIHVRSFVATVGSTTANITGTVLQGKPLGTGAFRASLDKLIAEEWAPPPQPKGKTPAPAPASPAAPPPIPLKAFDGVVTIGELQSGKTIVRDVTVPVKYADGTLTAAPITGRIGTGTIGGELTLHDLVSSKPSYALDMNVKRAPVEDLFGGLVPFKLPLTGFASGVVDLSGPGMPGQGAVDSLRGALSGTVEDGKIIETPTILGLRNALGLAPSSGSAGDIVFKTVTHSLRIDQGRLLLDKVKGDLGKDLFEMAGSMGLDQSLNLDMLLRLAPERIKGGTALAQFASYARDKDGRLPINVKITGSALAPKISIKGGKTVDTAVKNLGQEVIKSLTESGRHDSTRSDSTAAVDPLQKGRDALKRLLGK